MTTKTTLFITERETKGAIRFQETKENGEPLEIGSGALIGTLYLRKSELPTPFPTAIEVTIKWRDK
jgi:hypothetical protein